MDRFNILVALKNNLANDRQASTSIATVSHHKRIDQNVRESSFFERLFKNLQEVVFLFSHYEQNNNKLEDFEKSQYKNMKIWAFIKFSNNGVTREEVELDYY
uniref:Uncharacterized protein n=1 Tax=Rhizophagus irregularis (strain DAOM 181602 / DAOM 197198 / MUCL 43194) TaxID=747089 RepID=U9UMC7_RHIID